tara:strand:- start:2883 stop:3494 length:612 start_codon:yes stop_codon:yes gene_type:complete
MAANQEMRIIQLTDIQYEAKKLFEKKNKDYGDAFSEYGTVGILVRIGDKIKRSQQITKTGINLVKDEKLRDTLIDLHNYAAMGIMLLDENKNTHNKEKAEISEVELVLEDNESYLDEVLDNDHNYDDEVSSNNSSPSIEELTNKEYTVKNSWTFKGDNNNCYTCRVIVTDNTEFTVCSCLSYKYSKENPKTCKHVVNKDNKYY